MMTSPRQQQQGTWSNTLYHQHGRHHQAQQYGHHQQHSQRSAISHHNHIPHYQQQQHHRQQYHHHNQQQQHFNNRNQRQGQPPQLTLEKQRQQAASQPPPPLEQPPPPPPPPPEEPSEKVEEQSTAGLNGANAGQQGEAAERLQPEGVTPKVGAPFPLHPTKQDVRAAMEDLAEEIKFLDTKIRGSSSLSEEQQLALLEEPLHVRLASLWNGVLDCLLLERPLQKELEERPALGDFRVVDGGQRGHGRRRMR